LFVFVKKKIQTKLQMYTLGDEKQSFIIKYVFKMRYALSKKDLKVAPFATRAFLTVNMKYTSKMLSTLSKKYGDA
jgi:hypothetical protein